MSDKILVLGASGQLGSSLCNELGQHAIGLSSKDIDFCNPDKVAAVLCDFNPEFIINAAAYTAVDKAEEEESRAHLINADCPKVLAAIAKTKNIPLIHFSTDYVFSGEGSSPWKENDKTSPLNAYGRTKLEGEKAIEEVGGKYLIFRTSWLYSETGNNFVKTMLRLGKEKEVISVVDDQIGAPTYAFDLAKVVIKVLEQAKQTDSFISGIFHVANIGTTTWFEFAEEIFKYVSSKEINLKIREVKPIKSSEFPSTANRPLNSRLDCSKLRDTFGIEMPEWKDALHRCLDKIIKDEKK